jgi:Bacterial Ig-like domain (group 3)
MSALKRNLLVFAAAIVFAMVGFGTASALADTVPTISDSPNVTGSPRVGDTLTEGPATWTSITPVVGVPTTIWSHCVPGTLTCTQIATGSSGGTYVVTPADAGFGIVVQETATNGSTSGTLISAETLPVAPFNVTPPSITGTGLAGQILTETPGTWLGAQLPVSTSWLSCVGGSCTSIPAIGNTLALAGNLVGSTISVQETASNSGPATTTADSAPPVLVTSPSTTSVISVPAAPITNQPTTLVATVASSSALAPPQGTMSFQVAGQPITGCNAVAVQTMNQSAQVTCPGVFSAANSPEAVTAVFTPSVGAAAGPSTSPIYSMGVGTDSTTTTLDVSNPIVNAGKSATYTATVRPSLSGPFQPTGQVVFFDFGKRISQCPATPVHFAQGVGTAKCVVHYAGVGNHSITAFYLGDAGFGGSGSTPQAVSVKRLPPKIKGTVTSTLSWKFAFAPSSTRALSIILFKPELGTIITFTCRGPLCPFSHHSQTVKKVHGRVPATMNIGPPTSESKLHPRDVMTILLKRMGWIGKGYVFTIRAGKPPLDHIGCLAPGSTKIGVGCTTPVSTKKKKG